MMKIATGSNFDTKTKVLIEAVFEDELKTTNATLTKEIKQAVKDNVFKGKLSQLYVTKLPGSYYRVCVVGLGPKRKFTLERLRKALGKSVKKVRSMQQASCTTNVALVAACVLKEEAKDIARACAEGALLANYHFSKYYAKKRAEKNKPLKQISFVWKGATSFGAGLKEGKVIGESSNLVRDLVNDHAGEVNSLYLEKVAKKVASLHPKLKLRVLNKNEMTKLGMGSLLGVNAGSNNPPKLMILEFKNGGSEKPVAFVGKGITFDSGGYNLKPSKHIEDMKTDMGGTAAVLGTLRTAALLNIKKNILGVMAVCENMVSHTAQRPGDIVRAYNGKTIEIGNTDAEGRLVLADAMAYVDDKYKPAKMVTLATLTGACVVALGYYTAALMGKDETLIDELKNAGMNSGDRVWPMPFFDEYQDWMDGSISDLNNIAQRGKGYEAGSITAGVFLSNFVKDASWVHLDIAGSAYWGVSGDYLSKGATGSGVRVLSYWLLGKK